MRGTINEKIGSGGERAGMVTMSDIARRVGVSQATVSYVLSGRQSGVRVRDEMRQRILQTAADLGYRRNDMARAMSSGKSYVLGFVTRIAGQESSARMMVGAQEVASENGYSIQLMPLHGKSPDYAAAFARLAEQRVAGVLALNLKVDAIELLRQETERFEIPIAFMDDPPPLDWAMRVISDDRGGLRLALEHLIALGHHRIGFVSAQRESPLAEQRRALFLDLMAEYGLPVPNEFVLATDWVKPEIVEPAVHALLAPGRPRETYPTAFLTAGDLMAMVTMRTARALGYRVPQDLSVVGFADFISATFADPPLTTIAQPFEEIGRCAARYLLDCAHATNPGSGAEIVIPTYLVVRASTAPAV
ncbi:MAG: LacI family DNA-binding transcriptional regulator [Armatimonadota bacterium]